MTQHYMIALDGEAIALKNPQISLRETIAQTDQSGQSSATTASEQGHKAKTLMVSGIIPYANASHLTRLFELTAMRGEAGNKKIFRVACTLAQAVKFRQGVFAGDISVIPDPQFLAWKVAFTLAERFSVPEKREAVTPDDGAFSIDTQDVTKEDEQLSWFEKHILTPIENAL